MLIKYLNTNQNRSLTQLELYNNLKSMNYTYDCQAYSLAINKREIRSVVSHELENEAANYFQSERMGNHSRNVSSPDNWRCKSMQNLANQCGTFSHHSKNTIHIYDDNYSMTKTINGNYNQVPNSQHSFTSNINDRGVSKLDLSEIIQEVEEENVVESDGDYSIGMHTKNINNTHYQPEDVLDSCADFFHRYELHNSLSSISEESRESMSICSSRVASTLIVGGYKHDTPQTKTVRPSLNPSAKIQNYFSSPTKNSRGNKLHHNKGYIVQGHMGMNHSENNSQNNSRLLSPNEHLSVQPFATPTFNSPGNRNINCRELGSKSIGIGIEEIVERNSELSTPSKSPMNILITPKLRAQKEALLGGSEYGEYGEYGDVPNLESPMKATILDPLLYKDEGGNVAGCTGATVDEESFSHPYPSISESDMYLQQSSVFEDEVIYEENKEAEESELEGGGCNTGGSIGGPPPPPLESPPPPPLESPPPPPLPKREPWLNDLQGLPRSVPHDDIPQIGTARGNVGKSTQKSTHSVIRKGGNVVGVAGPVAEKSSRKTEGAAPKVRSRDKRSLEQKLSIKSKNTPFPPTIDISKYKKPPIFSTRRKGTKLSRFSRLSNLSGGKSSRINPFELVGSLETHAFKGKNPSEGVDSHASSLIMSIGRESKHFISIPKFSNKNGMLVEGPSSPRLTLTDSQPIQSLDYAIPINSPLLNDHPPTPFHTLPQHAKHSPIITTTNSSHPNALSQDISHTIKNSKSQPTGIKLVSKKEKSLGKNNPEKQPSIQINPNINDKRRTKHSKYCFETGTINMQKKRIVKGVTESIEAEIPDERTPSALPEPVIRERKNIGDSDKTMILPHNEQPVYEIQGGGLTERTALPDKNELKWKMTGFLLKHHPNMFSGAWNKRYCVLQYKQFKWFKDRAAHKMNGIIEFDRLHTDVHFNYKELIFRITILDQKKESVKEFKFKTTSKAELYEWEQSLSVHRINSLGLKTHKSIILHDPKFWKFQRIPLNEFEDLVENGDILLFKGQLLACKLQRMITRSNFDHVAILLRYSDGRLMLLEATSNEGVSISGWNDFKRCNGQDFYERVVYRRLNFNRTSININKLERFLKKVVGKRYKLNATKLFRKFSNKDSVENLHDNKSYFCSELVASVYKLLDILPKHISASHYWPGSFSAEKDLRLLNGAKLGPELLVDFKLKS